MGFHISRVQINNFRNFKELDIRLSEKAVIVGENASGKSNFIHALRLVLDPDLPDSARQLTEDDFWDGLDTPMKNGKEITVAVELQGFEENESLLSILSDYQIPDEETPTVRVTYKFAPEQIFSGNGDEEREINYIFTVHGGVDETQTFGYQQRKWMPLQVLPALRDAETDLNSWRRSPLRPLLERLNVARKQLESAAAKIDEGTQEITDLDEIKDLAGEIEDRLKQMIGEFHSVSTTFGVASTDALRLIRSLRLFVDGEKQRAISDTSFGICNILYLTLLVLELERKEAAGERGSTILAIEEPEAHLHPHLQRLAYRDFLRRESPVLLTTHSPNIVSISPIHSLMLLRNFGDEEGCKATCTARTEFTETEAQDLERYLDATRGEILFAKGVILVEGYAELYILPAMAKQLGKPLDEMGISVCSVHGTDFMPYIRLLGKSALNIPHVVITDGDPENRNADTIYHGNIRGVKIAGFKQPPKKKELMDLVTNRKWDKIDRLLEEFGVFVGTNTLEIDLCNEGYGDEFLATLEELGAGGKRLAKFKETLGNRNNGDESEADDEYILDTIEYFGKGRFAQRLAPKLVKERIPSYIENAMNHIIKLVTGQ